MKVVLGLEDGTIIKDVGFGAAGATVCEEVGFFSTQYSGHKGTYHHFTRQPDIDVHLPPYRQLRR